MPSSPTPPATATSYPTGDPAHAGGVAAAGGPPHVVVVGGGITGLAAAWALVRSQADLRITLLERGPVVGGHLGVGQVAGIPVDRGAESMVASRPEGVLLARQVGLEPELVAPGNTRTATFARGRARVLPRGQYLGVPTDLRALAANDVLSLPGLLRIPLDRVLRPTPTGSDISVGEFVSARLGQEVVDVLVDPLLDGVYGGRSADLSMAATMPALFRAVKQHRSLLAATTEIVSGGAAHAGARRGAPYRGLVGGLGRLPTHVAAALTQRGVQVRTSATVRGLTRRAGGWELLVGPTIEPESVMADAVVLALPTVPAARLLAGIAPAAAGALAGIEHASVAVVNLAYPVQAVTPPAATPSLLVPAGLGLAVKSVTCSDLKWPWIGAAARPAGLRVLRVVVGRHGQQQVLAQPDPDLVARVRVELELLLGLDSDPVDVLVSRWAAALPQYWVGHRDVVREVRAGMEVVPGVDIAGAAFDGVGVAACIGSANEAARRVLADLARMRALSG